MPLAHTPSATARSAAGSSSAGPPTSGASWSANPARAVASPSDGSSHGSNRGHLHPGTEHVALDAGSPPTRRPVGHPPQQDGPGHRPQSTQPALPPDPPETSYQASFWSRHVAQISHDGRQFRHGVFPPQLPLMSGVGIYPTLLVTTMDSAASSAWTRRTGGSWCLNA